MEFVRKHLAPPVFDDPEKTRIGQYVHWLSVALISGALVLGLANTLAGHPHTLSIAIGVSIILAGNMLLLRKGWVNAASLVVLGTAWVGTTLALVTGSGIHDIAIMLFPILAVVASFLLQRRGTFVMSALISLSAGVIIAGELLGFLDIPKTTSTDFVDWVTITIITLIGARTIGYMSDTLNRAVRQARENELAYAKSNQELATQADLLRESEERWRTLIQNVPDNILNIDPNGKIQLVNLASEAAQRLVGSSIFQIIPPEEHAAFSALIAKIIETGSPARHEGYAINLRGEKRWFAMRIAPIKDKHGHVTSLTIIATDISDRLATERSLKQRAEQLTALNQIGRGISALQNLDQALQTTLVHMQKILNLDVFYVGLYNGNQNTLSFPLMYDSGRLWNEPDAPVDPGGWIENVLVTRRPFLLNRTPEQTEVGPHGISVGDVTRASASIMVAPMELDTRFIGVVSVQSYTFNAYTEEDLLLLGNAAGQIAIAVENARLYQEAKHRAEIMTTLYHLGNVITSNLNLDGVMNELYESCKKLLPLNAFYIATYDEETGIIAHPIFFDQGRRVEVPARNIHERPGLSGYIITQKQTVYIPDVLDPQARETYQIIHIGGDPTRSYLGVPLLHTEKPIGVISVQNDKPHAYTDEHISLLETISTQAAIALVNARLYEDKQRELNERLQAEETVRTLNAELEKRVQERTAELQAFTYTVSHDLRAPLRSINGYSRIFQEDYGNLIPEEGRILLERIGNGARQMGILIDDLLTFSRLNRASLNKMNIDLTSLARNVFEELAEHEDKSRIDCLIADMPPAHADPVLIRQALTNLLSNAIKFTRNRERARIEMGSQIQDGVSVYYVRDNGAGFSMEHANKLFGVFQRLHHQEEFEGTGVGLAIVQRIIQQHGGRIWAESKVNQGATFYFTLGAAPDVINYAA